MDTLEARASLKSAVAANIRSVADRQKPAQTRPINVVDFARVKPPKPKLAKPRRMPRPNVGFQAVDDILDRIDTRASRFAKA